MSAPHATDYAQPDGRRTPTARDASLDDDAHSSGGSTGENLRISIPGGGNHADRTKEKHPQKKKREREWPAPSTLASVVAVMAVRRADLQRALLRQRQAACFWRRELEAGALRVLVAASLPRAASAVRREPLRLSVWTVVAACGYRCYVSPRLHSWRCEHRPCLPTGLRIRIVG